MKILVNVLLGIVSFIGTKIILNFIFEILIKESIIQSNWWQLISVTIAIILTFTLLHFHEQINKEKNHD